MRATKPARRTVTANDLIRALVAEGRKVEDRRDVLRRGVAAVLADLGLLPKARAA